MLANSYFPKCWQFALVTPIPKPGKDATIMENWRRISQLCCSSKIFERIIARRINIHIANGNIYHNQFGFLANNSTYHALAKIHSDINGGVNKHMVTTIVAIDLKAAFDTIWHDGLLHMMVQLGFPILLIKITQQILRFRTFAVRINDTLSEIEDVDAGVPQGSVLGPIYFNLYTHDIPISDRIDLTQFADDTTIHIVHKDPARAQHYLNKYLLEISNYFRNWRLQLNESKTELIHVMGQIRDINVRLRRNTRKKNENYNGRPSHSP